jgi:hypothetical protein
MFRRHKECPPQSKHADENHQSRLERETTDLGQKTVHRRRLRATLIQNDNIARAVIFVRPGPAAR